MAPRLQRCLQRAAIQMHMQLLPPIAVVLVIDAADGDAFARQHGFQCFTADHGQLDQFDGLFG